MEIIKIKDFSEIAPQPPTVLVLGYFDGLHLGHKALFDAARALADAKGWSVTVLTFPESPKLAFVRYRPELLLHLTSPEVRYAKMAEYGTDRLVLVNFTHTFSKMSAAQFLAHYIKGLNAQAVVTGFDYQFGHDRKSAADLEALFDGQVIVVPEVKLGQEKISSTRIRKSLQAGEVKEVSALLGRPYETSGIVVHGDARGRTIGYPTANLSLLDRIYLPGDGVYVADVEVRGRRLRGMASIGKNITFDGTELRIEVHIFDFAEDIYGEPIKIFWLAKIRDMLKLDGLEGLLAQLKEDEQVALNWQES